MMPNGAKSERLCRKCVWRRVFWGERSFVYLAADATVADAAARSADRFLVRDEKRFPIDSASAPTDCSPKKSNGAES